MTRFKNRRDRTRDGTRQTQREEEDDFDFQEHAENVYEEREGIVSNIDGIRDAISDGEVDTFDAATIALDTLALSETIIPGVDIPYVDFERVDETSFDELTPLNDFENVSYGALPWFTGDPSDCDSWGSGPLCQLEDFDITDGIGGGVDVTFSDCEICSEANVSAFGISMPLAMVCYRRDECLPDPGAPGGPGGPGHGTGGGIPPSGGGGSRTPRGRNCGRLEGDPPYNIFLVESVRLFHTKEVFPTEVDYAFDRLETKEYSSVAGLFDALPRGEEKNIFFHLRENGWRQTRRRSVRSLSPREISRNPSAKTTQIQFTRAAPGRGDGVPLEGTAFFAFQDLSIDILYLTQVTLQDRRELSYALGNYRYTYAGRDGEIKYNAEVFRPGRSTIPQITEDSYIPVACVLGPEDEFGDTDPPVNTGDTRMACCKDTEDKMDYIIAKMGFKNLPIKMDESMTDDEDTVVDVDNVTDVITTGLKGIFELIGEYPLKMKVRTDEGEVSREMEFPNLTEMIAEMFGMLFSAGRDADSAYAATIACLGMLTQNQAMMVSIHDLCDVMNQWAGMKMNPKKRELDLPFNPQVNPGTASQSELFTRTKVETQGYCYEDSMTLYAFQERLSMLVGKLEHASSISGTPDEIMEKLDELADIARGKKSDEDEEGEEEKVKDRIKEMERSINKYQKANGLPEVKLSLKK